MKPLFLCFYFLVLATQQSEGASCTKKIRAFVDGHNSRRLQVASGNLDGQPGASEMNLMIWDQELETKAMAWAAKHRDNRNNPDQTIPSKRFTTGENVYLFATLSRNYTLKPDQALEAWFIEHLDYTHDSEAFDRRDTGHYTQMVWSDSIYLGCAMAQYFKDKLNKFLVVCNYGPPGNYVGEKPYNAGGPSRNLTCGCEPNDSKCDCNKRYGGKC